MPDNKSVCPEHSGLCAGIKGFKQFSTVFAVVLVLLNIVYITYSGSEDKRLDEKLNYRYDLLHQVDIRRDIQVEEMYREISKISNKMATIEAGIKYLIEAQKRYDKKEGSGEQ